MAGEYNPFQGVLNPNMRQTSLWDLRMMSAANRSETPFERGMRTSYGHGLSNDPMLGGMAAMANEPDYSGFTYNPQMRQQAIAAGVQPLEASQVKQNVLLPNTGFFGSHPRLSAAIESGLFGAAASHGGMTTGESIQGALEGAIGGQRIRQGLQRQQFARPFESAGMLEGLADQKQRRELQSADIEHLRAVNQHLESGDDQKAAALMETNRHNEAVEAVKSAEAKTAADRIDATAPRNLGGGLYGYYNPGGTGANQKGDWGIQENPEARTGRAAANTPNAIDTRTGKLVKMQPGDDSRYIKPISALESGERLSQEHREKWIQSHMDKPSAARRVLGDTWKPEYTSNIEARKKALNDAYDKLDIGGADTDYVYSPSGDLVPTHK